MSRTRELQQRIRRIVIDSLEKIKRLREEEELGGEDISKLPKPELVNVSKTIREAISPHKNHLSRGIELETDIEENLMVYGYPDKLISVWSNIIYNAIQALGTKGTIKIRA